MTSRDEPFAVTSAVAGQGAGPDDALRRAVEPIIAAAGLALYDVELSGSGRGRVVRILVDGAPDEDAGSSGGERATPSVDRLEALTNDLDAVTEPLVHGSYLLEVSSPGLERPLRLPAHFEGAIGDTASVKFVPPGQSAAVRERAVIVDADRSSVRIRLDSGDEHTLAYDEILSARTVFEWGAKEPPGRGSKPGRRRAPTLTTGEGRNRR
jgi:ribosome maturation factor RimP